MRRIVAVVAGLVVLVVVNWSIYDREQLEEFAAASEVSDLTPDEMARIQALYESNFGIEPEAENAVAGAAR